MTKKNLQSRPCDLSKLALTSLVQRSLNLKISSFDSPKNNVSLQLASSPHILLHLTFMVWTFHPIHTFILFLGSPSLRGPTWYHQQKNTDGHICTSYGRVHLEGNHESTLGFGCVIMLQSTPANTQSIYQLIVSSMPGCNCLAFKDMISTHFYFIFVKVSNIDPDINLFIHTPILSFNEVKFILKGAS